MLGMVSLLWPTHLMPGWVCFASRSLHALCATYPVWMLALLAHSCIVAALGSWFTCWADAGEMRQSAQSLRT